MYTTSLTDINAGYEYIYGVYQKKTEPLIRLCKRVIVFKIELLGLSSYSAFLDFPMGIANNCAWFYNQLLVNYKLNSKIFKIKEKLFKWKQAYKNILFFITFYSHSYLQEFTSRTIKNHYR